MGKTKEGKRSAGPGPGPGSGRVAQSWEKSKNKVSKVRQAICRFCITSVAAQKYARHLKVTHATEEWKEKPWDLREFREKAISFFKTNCF